MTLMIPKTPTQREKSPRGKGQSKSSKSKKKNDNDKGDDKSHKKSASGARENKDDAVADDEVDAKKESSGSEKTNEKEPKGTPENIVVKPGEQSGQYMIFLPENVLAKKNISVTVTVDGQSVGSPLSLPP